MYALDNVFTVSTTTFDTSDIPAHIKAAYDRYAETKTTESVWYPDRLTPAQKRTSTMRFNKFCDLCESEGLDVPNLLMRLGNA